MKQTVDAYSWQERVALCESTGLTRKDIAAYCGMAYSTLCDLSAGNTNEPRGYAAVRLHQLSERCRKKRQRLAFNEES